jgi:hypothetical protein
MRDMWQERKKLGGESNQFGVANQSRGTAQQKATSLSPLHLLLIKKRIVRKLLYTIVCKMEEVFVLGKVFLEFFANLSCIGLAFHLFHHLAN